MKFPHVPKKSGLQDGLRITVGTDEEAETCLEHLGNIVLGLKA